MLLDAGAATKEHATLTKKTLEARGRGVRHGKETRMRCGMRLGSSRLVAREDELGAPYLLLVLHLRPCILKALGYIAAF